MQGVWLFRVALGVSVVRIVAVFCNFCPIVAKTGYLSFVLILSVLSQNAYCVARVRGRGREVTETKR